MSKSGSNRRARNFTISTRATEEEKRAIQAAANYHGLSMGSFMRFAAMSRKLPKGKCIPKDQGQFIAHVLASLGTIMNEVRRLERSGHPIETNLKVMERELRFLRDQCFTSLGRKP